MHNRLAVRLYRQKESGDEARLIAEAITDAATKHWCTIILERPDGSLGRIAGQHQVEWWTVPTMALRGYRQRLRALKVAGYRRVD